MILAEYYRDNDVLRFVRPMIKLDNLGDSLDYQGLRKDGEKKRKEPVPGYKMYIIKDLENQPVGKFWLEYLEHLNHIEIGCWICKPFWGKGYAFDAAKTIIKHLYESKIKNPIYSRTNIINDKSVRAHEKGLNALDLENYSLKREHMTSSYEVKNNEESSDSAFLFIYNPEETEKYEIEKKFVKPEDIEKGPIESHCLTFLLTPIY